MTNMGKVIALAVLYLILAVFCFIAACAEIWKTYDIDIDEWKEEKKTIRENIGA